MIDDKAQELGRLIGQAPEYQALRRAEQSLRDDAEAQKRLEIISRLTREFDQMMAQGQSPDEAKAQEYETTLREFELVTGRAGIPGGARERGQADDRGQPDDRRRDGAWRDQRDHHALTAAGFFLVLEGPEAAGKSTLARGVCRAMREDGVDPVMVREPGGTPVAEALRHELLDADREWTPEMELLYHDYRSGRPGARGDSSGVGARP